MYQFPLKSNRKLFSDYFNWVARGVLGASSESVRNSSRKSPNIL